MFIIIISQQNTDTVFINVKKHLIRDSLALTNGYEAQQTLKIQRWVWSQIRDENWAAVWELYKVTGMSESSSELRCVWVCLDEIHVWNESRTREVRDALCVCCVTRWTARIHCCCCSLESPLSTARLDVGAVNIKAQFILMKVTWRQKPSTGWLGCHNIRFNYMIMLAKWIHNNRIIAVSIEIIFNWSFFGFLCVLSLFCANKSPSKYECREVKRVCNHEIQKDNKKYKKTAN